MTDVNSASRTPGLSFEKFRKPLIIVALCVLWEAVVRGLHVNPLLFPTFSDVAIQLLRGLGIGGSGELWAYIWDTLSVLLQAYAISVILAIILTGLAVSNGWARDVLATLNGIFQPLPSIALLPMAILWFGFSRESVVFVVVMAMTWPIASSLTVGFATVSPTLVRLGRNYELSRIGLMVNVLLPSALPMMIAGLKVGWGFGWRTVVAAELVFGATGSGGGIGWYINNSRLFMNIADGFAGIILVVAIGLLTESLFLAVQRVTTYRWGTEAA
jgi:NitT/TauT family transport system permease protein